MATAKVHNHEFEDVKPEAEGGVVCLTDDDALALIDRRARKYLGISADEYIRRWHPGEIEDRSIYIGLSSLIPNRLRRRNP
jgi:hypothetical protein